MNIRTLLQLAIFSALVFGSFNLRAEERTALMRELSPKFLEGQGQYMATMQRHIQKFFNYPKEIPPNATCSVEVFKIPSGEVVKITPLDCENQELRNAVQNAINESSPLPMPENIDYYEPKIEFLFTAQ